MSLTREHIIIYKVCLLALLLVSITACSSDDYVDSSDEMKGTAITLTSANSVTSRATSNTLADYVKDFMLYGVKTKSSAYEEVFPNYAVWYGANTAYTTTSNTSDWEYVGSFSSFSGEVSSDKSKYTDKQLIKYWDYSADNYIFWAVGKADNLKSATKTVSTDKLLTSATFSNITETSLSTASNVIYYTKPTVVKSTSYGTPVTLQFMQAMSRIRFAFYETIPGYAVKDVKFYTTSGTTGDATCTVNGSYITSGTVKLEYDVDAANNYDNPSVSVSYDGTPTSTATKTFGSLQYTTPDDNRLTGSDELYLGRLSSAPTYAQGNADDGYYTNILPNQTNTTPLTLKVDYTLLSNDGSGQTITVKGATATVPAELCKWKANYSYTYLFKISDNTNGTTGSTGDSAGLYPITFVAYGENPNNTDNRQGTITTVDDYSITTHQEGDTDESGIAYEVVNERVDVSVILGNGSSTSKITLNGSTDYVVIYRQQTPYEWVVETTTSDNTTPSAGVYKETVNYSSGLAQFTPDFTGTYRVEYWHKENGSDAVKRAIKIVLVGDKRNTPPTSGAFTGQDLDDTDITW